MDIKELNNLCKKAIKLLGYGKPCNLKVDNTSKVASYKDTDNVITIDPEVIKYYPNMLKDIILHEACHVAEYDYAEKNDLRDDEDYMEEFEKTSGHTYIFKEFTDFISKELNNGKSVFTVKLDKINAPMDKRISELCEEVGIPENKVICEIDYFDTSINTPNGVSVKPKYYTGEELSEDDFIDIADSIAVYLKPNKEDPDYDDFIDEVYDIAYDIWDNSSN